MTTSSTAPLPTPVPEINPETQPFWTATGEDRLLLKRCLRCEATIWYPRSMCPACGAQETEWFDASGRGVIYTFTVTHQSAYSPAPYVLAYVDLEEGPRILTNIVGVDPADVAIGQHVKVVFHPTGAGPALYRFEPA